MDIRDYINIKDNTESPIERILKEREPIVVFGAGNVALHVIHYLEDHRVTISDVCVDDEYFNEDMEIGNYKVVPYSSIKEKHDSFSIVWGMGDYSRGETLKSHDNQIREIHYITSPSYLMTDPLDSNTIDKFATRYNQTFDILEDELSRNVMISWINAKVNDDPRFMFDYFQRGLNYFCNDIYEIGNKESFLDIGAYTGDSLEEFIKISGGQFDRIWAIEADPVNFKVLSQKVQQWDVKGINLINKALWDEHRFSKWGVIGENAESALVSEEGNQIIELFTLDELMDDQSDKVTLLKINFPGADRVLAGGVKTIKDSKPRIAVRVGFNEREIAGVPLFIKDHFPDYRVYFRYNLCIPSGLCMYAIV